MNIVIYHEQRLGQWRDVNKDEMKTYPSVCVIMGVNNLPKITDYWSSDIFTSNNGIRQTTTKNRFEEISQFFHLNNSSEEPAHGEENFDRLYKCCSPLTSLLRNAQPFYSLKKNISTNEGMIAFKGRLSFRQYLPAKPTKYGIKVWMAADASNGYIVNFSVYLESEGQKRQIHGLGYDVVMNMARPFLNRNHHVFFDNFFSSPILLEHLLDQQTYTCLTVRCTRRDLPSCSKNKLHQPEETVVRQRGSLLLTKWHDKRDVAFLSTNVLPNEPLELSNEYKMDEMSKSKSRMSPTFTRKVWEELIKQINFDLPI